MGSEAESEGGDATELGSTGLSLAKVSPLTLLGCLVLGAIFQRLTKKRPGFLKKLEN